MELVATQGGVGEVRVTDKESKLIQDISDIAGRHDFCGLVWGNSNDARQLKQALGDVFPQFPLHYVEGDGYRISRRTYGDIADTSFRESLGIESTLSLGRDYTSVTLSIMTPLQQQNNEYLVTLWINPHQYTLGCKDDIVKLLGQRENPSLRGVEPIKNSSNRRQYGIADVTRLNTILGLYDKAVLLISSSEESIGLSEHDLNILRRDSLGHENIVLRELSQQRYKTELERLITR